LSTRPPFERMQKIFEAIKSGKYPGRDTLAADIEVVSKTIQRDIDFMRDRFQLPIEYSRGHKGYYFSEPIENFPFFQLSEHELVSLLVAQKQWPSTKALPSKLHL
jgi:predicted DNA-binding transcriptional regulator YafY